MWKANLVQALCPFSRLDPVAQSDTCWKAARWPNGHRRISHQHRQHPKYCFKVVICNWLDVHSLGGGTALPRKLTSFGNTFVGNHPPLCHWKLYFPFLAPSLRYFSLLSWALQLQWAWSSTIRSWPGCCALATTHMTEKQETALI